MTKRGEEQYLLNISTSIIYIYKKISIQSLFVYDTESRRQEKVQVQNQLYYWRNNADKRVILV